jgi:hypothetical protein
MSGEIETGNLVTVAEFTEPASVSVARQVLESAGIAVFVQGENANSLLPVAFMARLQVLESDEKAAREVLAGAELAPESMEDVTAAEIADEGAVK